MNEFIPTGRTSVVKSQTVSLQVQTEYAHRPYPRITTTILNGGQVVHKIERKLDEPILTFEEQTKADEIIKIQHQEVLNTIGNSKSKVEKAKKELADSQLIAQVEFDSQSTASELSMDEQIKALPGFRFLFPLSLSGKFLDYEEEAIFKSQFKKIYADLNYLFDIFILLPGGDSREQGVYEVKEDHLYLISIGNMFYFSSFKRVDIETNYEKLLKEITQPVFT